MKLRNLEYLVALAEEKHFHKAAARCCVSQPTLSGQLKKLEAELGVLLVERSSRCVEMTAVGQVIYQQARRVLAESKLLTEMAQTYHDPMKGDLRLGIIPTIAPYLLPLIMSPLSSSFPDLKVWLYEYRTDLLCEKLERGELDCLILALPIERHNFAEYDLFREPFRLALNHQHALARKKQVNLGDIQGLQMLLLEEGHCLRGHVLDVCHLAGAKENRAFQATSLETLRHMIAEGMGATLMPELAVPKQSDDKEAVHYLEFSDPKPYRRVGMLFRRNSYRKEVFKQVAEVISLALPLSVFY